jgi:hypothetical protein
MARVIFKILFLLLLLPSNLSGQEADMNYSASSVLSAGKWFKIALTEEGIYKIEFAKLKQLGLDNPSCSRVFGNNSGQQSYFNSNPVADDLEEIAVSLQKGIDGIFNEGDYLLFYGKSTHKWIYDEISGEFDFLRHNYSDTTFYFITSGSAPGKMISQADKPSSDVNSYSSESDALFIHEKETENLIKSGREWYQPVSYVNDTEIDPRFAGINTSEPVKFSVRVLSRASVPTIFRLYWNGSPLESIYVSGVNLTSTTGTFAQAATSSWESSTAASAPVFQLKFFNNGEISAKAWLDYIKVHARKNNVFNGETNFYTDIRSVAQGNITEFNIGSSVDGAIIWDVTDPHEAKIMQYEMSGNNIKFTARTDTLRRFAVFTSEKAMIPIFKNQPLANQDLHASVSADMIIITHPLFKSYALKLAEIHKRNSGLSSLIVTPEQIYNEFSGGVPDITAIRNFIRMKYLRQQGSDHPLKYLLLFGDGSYENKTSPPGNPNFIPTYQSQNSNVIISSFTSDDFYGLLEEGEGEDSGTLDIGTGRLPVSDTAQAGIIVSKIRNYVGHSDPGEWKNVVCLAADDEDGNTHLSDAEKLSGIITDSIPWINIDKIYFDSFRQVTSSSGQSYPGVTQAINERINTGTLIFNYTGHGNETSLAHERVVTLGTINQWKNKSRLPLFITATCEFSRFDNIDINAVTREITESSSAGEKILLSSDGGGIALMSTTRLVYAAPNFELNRNIFDFAFDRDAEGKALRLGDIIRLAKNSSANNSNRRNFLLLGDPALRLAYPWHGKVVTDSINNVSVNVVTDSLKALSMITVAGHIEDEAGRELNDFGGLVSPTVFGKSVSVQTLSNDGGEKNEFSMRNNVLFSGKTNSKNGRFRFSFIVPRDIDYNFGQGKISYYASGDEIDGTGYYDGIIVGGFDGKAESDSAGPEIKLFLNDTLFRDGGMTDQNPKLYAVIDDKDGLNTAGTGIGHDLTCWLDDDRDNTFVLNNYFENDFGSYRKGSVTFPFFGMVRGNHTITLKAWDNFNNSSEKTLAFFVEDKEAFILSNIINYPNPFTSETKISAGHNRPEEESEITIMIFDITGRIIRIIMSSSVPAGYQIAPVTWDGTDAYGKKVGRGVYIYRISARTKGGETATASGRMIFL